MPRILSAQNIADFRERLCEAAAELFVESGRDGFNMRALAARMGVSAMTPYRYFEDRNAIFAAVRARAFRQFAEALESAFARPGSPMEKAQRVGHAYVQFAFEETTSYKLMFDLFQPDEDQSPELAAAGARAKATMTRHIDLLVREGVLAGEALLISRVIWASLHGVVVLKLAGKLSDSCFERIRNESMRTLFMAYRGPKMPSSA